jgi:hypothetical protein
MIVPADILLLTRDDTCYEKEKAMPHRNVLEIFSDYI